MFGIAMAPEVASQNVFIRSVNALSILAIPFLLSFFPLYAAARGVKVYDEFVEGAKEGFGVILKIIPFLVTMLVAIGMFKGAGGIDLLSRLLSPILTPLQFPTDLLPLALMRPLSGSATLALLTDIVHRLGPDNIVSLTAATIYGSTETTFYVASHGNKTNATCDPGRLAGRSHGRHRIGDYLPSGSVKRTRGRKPTNQSLKSGMLQPF